MLQLNISVAHGELRKYVANTFSKCISDLLGLGGVMMIFQPVFWKESYHLLQFLCCWN